MATIILVVEDDPDLIEVLQDLLQGENYVIQKANSGSEALRIIDHSPPDLVLLDLGLPDIAGESVLKTVREEHPRLPVIILTAQSQTAQIAAGLNLGADDYLAKPFAAEELLARIKARLRPIGYDQDSISIGNLTIDLKTREVKRNQQEIILTKTEFDLLVYLVRNQGRVLSRDSILNHVWEYSPDIESRVVDVYIGYLRKKIDDGRSNKLIHSKHGIGYFIKV